MIDKIRNDNVEEDVTAPVVLFFVHHETALVNIEGYLIDISSSLRVEISLLLLISVVALDAPWIF
jgi:hypothetical protein